MILGDATMYYRSCNALIKFEQGAKQKEFLFHLFDVFSGYCFMSEPGTRFKKDKSVKSYWFKTFSFPDFTRLFFLFHETRKKSWKMEKNNQGRASSWFFNSKRTSLLDYV